MCASDPKGWMFAEGCRLRRHPPCAFSIVLAAVLSISLGPYSVTAQEQPRPQVTTQRGKTKAAPKDDLTQRLELMVRAMRIARGTHVAKPENAELVRGAIEGLLGSLDAEAEYYSPTLFRELSAKAARADSAGIGLELRREPPGRRRERLGYRVVTVSDGSPAAEAGMRAGQLVTDIDGLAAGSMSPLDVAWSRMPGLAGSSVLLRTERMGETASEDLKLTRRETRKPGIAARRLDQGVVYLRIANLEPSSALEIERELQSVAGAGEAVTAAVLDLRSASGGTTREADAVADVFMATGDLGRVKTKAGASVARLSARPGDALRGQPLLILIDGGTAGPLESLSAVLKESSRARLIGIRTAGRGAIRSLLPLGPQGEKGALWLATAQMLTPGGKLIEGKGIDPDIIAEQVSGERDCRTLDKWDASERRCVARLPEQDAQLQRALGVLAESKSVAEKNVERPGRP